MFEALEREKKIFSVLVRNIDFHGLPLSKSQALPTDRSGNLKAISDWTGKFGRDRAWVQVAHAIRADVHGLSEPFAHSQKIDWKVTESSFERLEKSVISDVNVEIKFQDRMCDIGEVHGRIEKEINYYLTDIDNLKSELYIRGEYFIHFSSKCTFMNNNFRSILIEVEHFFGGAHRNYDLLGINLQVGDGQNYNLEDFVISGINNEAFSDKLVEEILKEKLLRVSGYEAIEQSDREDLRHEIRQVIMNIERIDFVIVNYDDDFVEHGQAMMFLFPNYILGAFAEGSYLVKLHFQKIELQLTTWARAEFLSRT